MEKKVFTDEAEYWVAKKIWDARVKAVTDSIVEGHLDYESKLDRLAKELPVFDAPQKFSDRHPNLFITGLFAAVVAVAFLVAWILSSLGLAG